MTIYIEPFIPKPFATMNTLRVSSRLLDFRLMEITQLYIYTYIYIYIYTYIYLIYIYIL